LGDLFFVSASTYNRVASWHGVALANADDERSVLWQGFDDRELNKKLLIKNGGSIKRVVLDLIAGKTE